MSFNILYGDGDDTVSHTYSIATYIDSFAESLGLTELEIDTACLSQVISGLSQPLFPHTDGVHKASPFKKAANFFVWFVASKPILRELPVSIVGTKLQSINNHQNVIFAYHMAVDCLHKARIYRKDETFVTLENRIVVSKHFFRDFRGRFLGCRPGLPFSRSFAHLRAVGLQG